MANAAQGAATAPAHHRSRFPRQFRLALLAGLLAVAAIAAESPTVIQAHSTTGRYGRTEAQRIVRVAASHIGAHFRMGSTGPRYFDCSGFVYRVYQQAGLINKIGGKRRLAAGYYHWFKQHHQVSRSHPQIGDIVIWTEKGKIAHSGVYVGSGHVISALINPWGVKRTHITTLHARFFAFLHVHLKQ